jgi:hypothetical protein
MQPNSKNIPFSRWLLFMFLLAFACVGTTLFAGDRLCRWSIESNLPYYPEARVVSIENNYLRPRAIGQTIVVLSSPDDVETVKQFYRDFTIARMNSEAARGLASTSWAVEPAPDGNGSIIRLFSECGT